MLKSFNKEITLTTNGSLLKKYAKDLKHNPEKDFYRQKH